VYLNLEKKRERKQREKQTGGKREGDSVKKQKYEGGERGFLHD